MIKTGEIKEGVTPPEKGANDKTASSDNQQLEDHLTKRAADKVTETLKPK